MVMMNVVLSILRNILLLFSAKLRALIELVSVFKVLGVLCLVCLLFSR